MCLFRCIAVHLGARPDRCTEKATELGKKFFGASDQQMPLMRAVEFTELKKAEEKFKLGIRVYEPSEDGTWRLIRQPAHYEANDHWLVRRPHLLDQGHQEGGQHLRLRPLQSTVYASNSSTAPRRPLYKG